VFIRGSVRVRAERRPLRPGGRMSEPVRAFAALCAGAARPACGTRVVEVGRGSGEVRRANGRFIGRQVAQSSVNNGSACVAAAGRRKQ